MTLNYITYKNPHPRLRDGSRDNGPKELAEVVIHSWQQSLPEFLGAEWLSKDGLKGCIECAYYASLEQEEGRYPRCSLFWSERPHDWFDLSSFSQGMNLNVENLRRLAPVCQTRDTAIRVRLRGGVLEMVGTTALGFEGLDYYPGRPGFQNTGREINIQVYVLGPGRLRVNAGLYEFELRAGHLRQCINLISLPAVRDLSQEFGMSVGCEVKNKLQADEEQKRLFGGLDTCLRGAPILERLLRPIVDGGHGGTVLVFPDRKGELKNVPLVIDRQVVDHSLLEYAVDHVCACVEYHGLKKTVNDVSSHMRICLQTRGRLGLAAKAIGELASVDGCVVLDRNLGVVGFGAKIDISKDRVKAPGIPFINAKTREEVPTSELEKLGGMRLRSAVGFCQSVPNVIAFVVSQDQEMKVLWSDEDYAFAYGPIAMSTLSDSVA